MMKTRIFILALAVLPLTPLIGAPVQNPGGPTNGLSNQIGGEVLSLESVVEEVLHHNRSLKAAQANWQAMKQRIPQARAWEDLRAGVDVERVGTTRFDTF